jgi:DNA polymerase I-like protein with 3'-5' exonuclease and polymerase domains
MFMYLYRYHIHVSGPIGDTMVAFNIIYPEFKKGLDTISSIYTREPYYKDDGKIWNRPFRDMDLFWRYNAKDAAVAMESWIALEQEIKQGGYQTTYDNAVGMYDTLLYMMIKGLELDKESLDATRAQQSKQLEEAKAELEQVADYPFNPISPKQCQDYFYVHKRARPYVSPRTGQVTTDDLALARLWRRHRWPELRLAQTIRGLTKLIGTYYDVIPDPDGRLRWSYNPRGTWTGRLSSSQTVFGTGLNIQNLDPAFKEFIIPDLLMEGY